MNLSAPPNGCPPSSANTMYCLLCSFIPCPWEEIWYCACLLNDFKTSIHYLLLTVLPSTACSAISEKHFMLALFFFFLHKTLSHSPEYLQKPKLLSLASKGLKVVRFPMFSNYFTSTEYKFTIETRLTYSFVSIFLYII